ncbi:MAG TPA: hypothetical protein VFU02_18360 [Polyangiaceae bacterium]|nr:hypothetical protein [Polyangiaceae bacterium]
MQSRRPIMLALGLLPCAPAHAEVESESRGSLGLEARVFWPDDDPGTDVGNISAVARLQADLERQPVAARARGFARADPQDEARTLLVPEELWIQGEQGPLRVRFGFQMLNWTATEAFHPADVINSRILDGGFENPEKRGELIYSLRLDVHNGYVEVMAMPLFIPPVFPSERSPLDLAPPGARMDQSLVLQRDGLLSDRRFQPQWAALVSQTWGKADISVHVVWHIDRLLPFFVVDPDGAPRPVFQALTQVGGTYQHALGGDLLVKLESAYRRFEQPGTSMTPYGPVPERDHAIGALGFEYTWVTEGGAELHPLLEAQLFVPLVRDFERLYAPLFDHDVLVGFRFDGNDTQSRAITFTAIVDMVTPEQLVLAAIYSQRVGEQWSTKTGLRILRYPPDPDNPVFWENTNNAHHLFFELVRHV